MKYFFCMFRNRKCYYEILVKAERTGSFLCSQTCQLQELQSINYTPKFKDNVYCWSLRVDIVIHKNP